MCEVWWDEGGFGVGWNGVGRDVCDWDCMWGIVGCDCDEEYGIESG